MHSVYKVTNTINGRYYFGSTNNIKERFMRHKTNYYFKQYPNSEFYQEIEKFGADSFEFEVLETFFDIVDASRMESRLIRKNKNDTLMYNKSMGASGRRVLSEEDIVFIRKLYASKTIGIDEAYDLHYKNVISHRAFKKAWHGDTFKDIYYHVYTSENKSYHFSLGQSRKGERNRSSVFREIDVIDIRTRQKNGENKKDVKKLYEHLNAPHGFDGIWKGDNWKHIQI